MSFQVSSVLDKDERHYVDLLVKTLQGCLADDLVAVFLSGSLCFDDYRSWRSDMDVLVVSCSPLDEEKKRALGRCLPHDRLPCPAQGLDLVVFGREALAQPARRPNFAYAIATGADWETDISCGGADGDSLVDLAICAARGHALFGPAPSELIGPIPRTWLQSQVRTILSWHRRHIHHPFHDPLGHNAVLNACRAWFYYEENQFCSKSRGAEWALARCPLKAVIEKARAARLPNFPNHPDHRLKKEDVEKLLCWVETRLIPSPG